MLAISLPPNEFVSQSRANITPQNDVDPYPYFGLKQHRSKLNFNLFKDVLLRYFVITVAQVTDISSQFRWNESLNVFS